MEKQQPNLVAFIGALLGAPFAVAILGLLIAVVSGAFTWVGETLDLQIIQQITAIPLFVGAVLGFSLIFGGPSYLLVGGPGLWLAIRSCHQPNRRNGLLGVAVGLASNIVAGLLAIPVLVILGETPQTSYEISLFIHGFGLFCAPIYGAAAMMIYSALMRPSAYANDVKHLPPQADPE